MIWIYFTRGYNGKVKVMECGKQRESRELNDAA
jgi:hypothetical protein